MIDELRKVKEIEACPKCGHDFLVFSNKGNTRAWAHCMECAEETSLEFAEQYVGKLHKRMATAGYTHSYSIRKKDPK